MIESSQIFRAEKYLDVTKVVHLSKEYVGKTKEIGFNVFVCKNASRALRKKHLCFTLPTEFV